MTDNCQRCGRGPDPDLRSLWMACLYAMNELPIPFDEVELQDAKYAERTGTETNTAFGIQVAVFEESTAEPANRRFFTLRVCKNCRADWMQAIKQWWEEPVTDPDKCNSGFYTRMLGATRQAPPDDILHRKKKTDA